MKNRHNARTTRVAGAIAILASLGCDAGSNAVAVDPASAVQSRIVGLKYISGSNQIGVPGAALPDSLVLRAIDGRGRPLNRARIDFEVSGGGSVSPVSGYTDSNGRVRAAWTLGPDAGQRVVARAPGAELATKPGADSVVVFTATLVALTVVSVEPAIVNFNRLGQSQQLQATALDQRGQPVNAAATWRSEGAAATVNQSGVVTAQANGTALVIATAGNLTDTAHVSVTVPTAPALTTVEVEPASVSLGGVGQTAQLRAIARDQFGDPMTMSISWRAVGSAVVVSSSGLVTAQQSGAALVIASAGALADTSQVSVSPPATPVLSSVSVTPSTLSLTAVGQTSQLQSVARDQYGNPITATISWRAVGTAAAVNASGLVTAQGNGVTLVIATAGGFADTTQVSVSLPYTPPPPSPEEPTFGATATSAFFDDFERYSSTADLLDYGARYANRWLSAGEERIALSTVGGISGTRAARITYVQGISQQYRLIEATSIPGDPTALVVQFWVRTMPGYEWINSTGNTHKLFNMDRPGGRILFSSGTEDQTPAIPAYGRLGELRPHFSVGTNNFNQNLNYDRARMGPGGSEVQVNDGNWHRMTLRITKSTSGNNGRLEMWLDGIKIIEFLGDDPGRPEYGMVNVGTEKLIAGIRFPSTMNAAPSRDQWIEYDDVRIWY